jgi:hypothetical protein
MRNTPTGKKIRTPPKNSGRRVGAVQGIHIHGYSWLAHDERTAFMARGILVWALLMGLVSLEACRWRIGVSFIIVWVLLVGLGGLLWALLLNTFGDDQHPDDVRQAGNGSLADHDGKAPHIRSFQDSEAA